MLRENVFLMNRKLSGRIWRCNGRKTSVFSNTNLFDHYSVKPPMWFQQFREINYKAGISKIIETARNNIFQLMAKNMSQKEVKKFVEHWNTKLVDEGHATLTGTEVAPNPSNSRTDVSSSFSTVEPTTPIASATTTIESKGDVLLFHPLLGELISDLGYKRIYATSVHGLARTPVWKKQRILRPERAALIAEDKIRRGIHMNLPGAITLYQDSKTQEIGIIDGQHRAGALMILAQRGYWNERKRNIIVEVFPTSTEDDISILFREINAAEPVRLIDLPDVKGMDEEDNYVEEDKPKVKETPAASADGKTSANTNASKNAVEEASNNITAKTKSSRKRLTAEESKLVITEALEILKSQYSEMFKPTSRCKIPHLNVDVLRDELFAGNILSARKITTSQELLKVLDEINKSLETKYQNIKKAEAADVSTGSSAAEGSSEGFSKSFRTALAKAEKIQFYLGMEKNWIYH